MIHPVEYKDVVNDAYTLSQWSFALWVICVKHKGSVPQEIPPWQKVKSWVDINDDKDADMPFYLS